MITLTSLKHPTMIRKVRRAVWLAKLAAHAQAKGLPAPADYRRHAKQHYVANRYGHLIMRVDYSIQSGITVYGDCSVNITHTIKQALQESK